MSARCDFPGVLQPEVCETTFSITPDVDVVVKVVNREPVVLLKPAYEANIQPSSVLLARDTTLATVTMTVYLELLPSSAAFTLPTDEQISTCASWSAIRNLSEIFGCYTLTISLSKLSFLECLRRSTMPRPKRGW